MLAFFTYRRTQIKQGPVFRPLASKGVNLVLMKSVCSP